MGVMRPQPRYSTPPKPEVDPVKAAWENLTYKGTPPGDEVREEISRSWLKCREIGLDPFSKNSPPTLSKGKLLNLLKNNRHLIEISKPVMDMIEISVKGTGFIITLTQEHGYVLVVRGDRDIMKMARENYYLPGCLRTNEHAGTNAIGLCLTECKPIQLTGAEHYKVQHHNWTCSSAPIYDSHKQLIGAITLSGRSSSRHKHTLALVTEAADTIQSQLRESDLIEEKNRLNLMLTSIFNSISDGVISVDNYLNITNINSSAARMLDTDADSVIGRQLEEVVHPDDPLIRALKAKKYLAGIETSFLSPSGQKNYMCRVDPIRNTSGEVLGTIITMAEKRHMINIAKRLGGNYSKYEFKDIKGNSPTFQRQIELAKIAAQTNSKILIVGESGTGKELFAQAIHSCSNRKKEPFVAISCAAIPRDLIESELFGYQGGAFTGARREGMVGKFELAHKGTLFLDEIDGLPLELQAKLLRVLQQKEIMRLGDTRCIPVDVRVIAASGTDLLTEVENGNFREDLYYRLNVVEIVIPPLRERIEDIELLIDHILTRQCQEMGIERPDISDEVLEAMKAYQWPGNVRELENCVERMLLVSQGNTIRTNDLPLKPRKREARIENGVLTFRQGYKDMIEGALEQCGGNISMAAKKLNIARSTFYRKMKEFGLT
jgi:PAS domain S-box-containing protein